MGGRLIIALATTSALLLDCTAAIAQSNSGAYVAQPRDNNEMLATVETKVLVHFGDLDLGSRTARHKLDRRILSAARHACDEQRLPSAAQQERIAACVADSQAHARHDVEQALARRDVTRAVAVASSSNPRM